MKALWIFAKYVLQNHILNGIFWERIEDKISDEKLQYDINREAAKISSDETGKFEYLTDRKILPSYQGQMIEQAKFIYSILGKNFEKQTKKQVYAFKVFKIDELNQTYISTKLDEWLDFW